MTPAVLLEASALQVGIGRALFAPLDLRLVAGAVTLISGENGVGKSSLLRTLAGESPAFSGSLWRAPALRICHFSQHGGLLPAGPFSVGDMLRISGCRGQSHPWIPSNAGLRVDRLSGGQRQRLMLALALAEDSELLLLDEPTQYLDQTSRTTFYAGLAELASVSKAPGVRGRAVVVVSHDAPAAQCAVQHLRLEALRGD